MSCPENCPSTKYEMKVGGDFVWVAVYFEEEDGWFIGPLTEATKNTKLSAGGKNHTYYDLMNGLSYSWFGDKVNYGQEWILIKPKSSFNIAAVIETLKLPGDTNKFTKFYNKMIKVKSPKKQSKR